MIDPDLIETLDNETQIALKNALITLAGSGILRKQMDRELMRLANGSMTENPEILTNEILDYRKRVAGLQILESYGQLYLQGRGTNS